MPGNSPKWLRKQSRGARLFSGRDQGPRPQGWKETKGAAALEGHQSFLSDPAPPLCCSVFLPASAARVAAPAMDPCFFQINKASFYFMLTYLCLPISLPLGQQPKAPGLPRPPSVQAAGPVAPPVDREREEVRPGTPFRLPPLQGWQRGRASMMQTCTYSPSVLALEFPGGRVYCRGELAQNQKLL